MDNNKENLKLSRREFLSVIGGMAAATVFWKFSSVTSLFTTGSWQSASVANVNSYGNSAYGGTQ